MKPDSPVADTSVRLSDDPPERSAVFAREGLEHRTRKVDSTFGSDAPSLEERIVRGEPNVRTSEKPGPLFRTMR
jgi:hypothetical protein